MSITAATLQVRVDADASPAEAKLNSFSRALSGLATGAMMGVGMAAANAISNAMRGAVAGMGDAVQAASDLGETVNMMSVIMGDASAATLEWSESAATALGMSQNQALRAAGTFAAFGKATGLAGEDLEQFSTGLVSLATDLGSLYNTSPEQAITAIGAALRGESEPIRAYNILLDEMTLRQAALTLGIVDNIKTALTPQQRVLAAEAELWRQSADARGDFANTSANLAGQQKILTANMTEFSATMGTAFLPVVLQTTTALNTGLGVAMPYLSSVMSGVFVPALNAGITGITNFIGAQMGISTAFDGSEESVRQFTTVFVEGINNQIQGLNQGITAIEGWVNLTRFSLDQFDQRWDQSVISLIVNINQIIAALNSGWVAGNDFFNNFGREMAKLTGNAWSPSEPRQGIAPLTVPRDKKYGAFSPTALPRLGEMTIDWDATVTNPATLAAEQAGKAIATTATQAGQDLTGAVGNFSQAAGDAMDNLAGKVSSAVSGLTNMPGVSLPNMPRQDEANENARRMAAIANEGISGQSWLDKFKAEMPQLYADVMASTDPKAFAQNWVLDFQAGLHPEALDREMIKANIRRMILGEETMAAYVEEISAEIRAENGLAPAATAIVTGVTNALTNQNMGAAVGSATIASVNTPTAVVQFESAGESAFGSWRAGWEAAAGGWQPPAPNAPPSGGATDFTGSDPLTGKPFGLTIEPPGTQMQSTGKPPITVTVTVNAATPNPGAVGSAAGRSVLDALAAKGY